MNSDARPFALTGPFFVSKSLLPGALLLAACGGGDPGTEMDDGFATGGAPGGNGSGGALGSGAGGLVASGGGLASGGSSLGTGGGEALGGGGAPGSGGAWGSGGDPMAGGGALGTGGEGVGGDPAGAGGALGTGGSHSGCDAAGFYTAAGKLYDVNCNEFIMRGVNVPHAWYSDRTEQAFVDVASVGGNAVRVVLATGDQWTRTAGSTVSQIISWAKANKLVAMLEVHDSTGFGDSSGAVHPDSAVSYWKSSDVLAAITGQEAYVLINIANEPFGNSMNKQQDADTWREFHVGAVAELRQAGLGHTFVVDAPNWGQDWQNIMRDGPEAQAIFDADPEKNVVFSVHMYDVYSSANVVTSYFDSFLAKGLPFIVGEFAADHGAGTNVDEATIMAEAQARGFGYLGWSWSGNGEGLGSLDMTNQFNLASLTSWGTTIIDGANGLTATGKVCTCFD